MRRTKNVHFYANKKHRQIFLQNNPISKLDHCMYKEQTLKTICCTVVYAKQIFFSFTIMFLANTLVEKSTDPEVHLVVSWFPPVPAPAIYLNHQTFITHF